MTGASDDGQAGVTGMDRARAALVANRLSVTDGVLGQREVIAAALAAERAQARAPFLAVAERWKATSDQYLTLSREAETAEHRQRAWDQHLTFGEVVADIRRAAEEQQ